VLHSDQPINIVSLDILEEMTVDSLTKKLALILWKLIIHHRLHKSNLSVSKSPELMGLLSYYLYQIFLSVLVG
jgi:hypothetical protein